MAKGERLKNEDDNSPDLDQYAKDALDHLFNKEQQTYEELLQGFTFLTKEDVTGLKTQSSLIVAQNGDEHQAKTTNGEAAIKGTISEDQSRQVKKNHIPEENDLSEELLGPGSTTDSILVRTAELPGRTVPQVDNFVDCEDEESERDDTCGMEANSADSAIQDDFLSWTYSPSVTSLPSTSTSKEINDTRSQDLTDKTKAGLDNKNLENKEIFYLSEGVLSLPGEVDDQDVTSEQVLGSSSKIVVKPNLTQLQISTRINNMDDKNKGSSMEGQDTNEVQPFKLDADFDYDNIALTPKFHFPPKHL